MKQEIILSPHGNGCWNWMFYIDDVFIAGGVESSRFEAFKVACAAYDREPAKQSWIESEW